MKNAKKEIGESKVFVLEVLFGVIRQILTMTDMYGYVLNCEIGDRVRKGNDPEYEVFKVTGSVRIRGCLGDNFFVDDFRGEVVIHPSDGDKYWHQGTASGMLLFNGWEYYFAAGYGTGELEVQVGQRSMVNYFPKALDQKTPLSLSQLKKSTNKRVALLLENEKYGYVEGSLNHVFEDSLLIDIGVTLTPKFDNIKKAWLLPKDK